MKGERVHCALSDRKRWLMSPRPFPAVKKNPGMLEVTSAALPVLGGQRLERLLVGFFQTS